MVQVESVNAVLVTLPSWQQNSSSSSLGFKMRCSLNCLSPWFVSMWFPQTVFLVFNHDFFPNTDKKNVLNVEVESKFYCLEYLSRFTIWGILCSYYKHNMKMKLQYFHSKKTHLITLFVTCILLYCIVSTNCLDIRGLWMSR